MHGWEVAWLIFLILTTVAFESFGVAMMLPILEYVESGGNLDELASSSRGWQALSSLFDLIGAQISLLGLCIAAFVSIALRQVMSFFSALETARFTQRTEKMLAEQCFSGVLSSNATHIEAVGTGSFVDVIYQQCQVSGKLIITFATALRLLVTIFAYGVVMLATSVAGTILAALVVLTAVLSVSYFVRLTKRITEERVAAQRAYSQHLNERFRAWRLIKLSGALIAETVRFESITRNLYQLGVRIARSIGMVQIIVIPLMASFALASLYVSVEYLSIGLATITVFVVILLRLVPIAEGVSRSRQAVANGTPSLERVVSVIGYAAAQYEDQGGVLECPALSDSISIDCVSFTYPGSEHAALHDVNAVIGAGQLTSLVGHSGAGKSTLVDLIPRLIAPTTGRILWDRTPVEKFSLSSLRKQIAFLPQTPFILDATVMENVTYGTDSISEEDARRACELANASQFVEKLPSGYATRIGEDGSLLSGGERQRIALARALLKRASLIILDEPTSALDPESQEAIRDALRNLLNEFRCTLVMITHSSTANGDADQVIRLEQGRLI